MIRAFGGSDGLVCLTPFSQPREVLPEGGMACALSVELGDDAPVEWRGATGTVVSASRRN
jgi:hypothetical protein